MLLSSSKIMISLKKINIILQLQKPHPFTISIWYGSDMHIPDKIPNSWKCKNAMLIWYLLNKINVVSWVVSHFIIDLRVVFVSMQVLYFCIITVSQYLEKLTGVTLYIHTFYVAGLFCCGVITILPRYSKRKWTSLATFFVKSLTLFKTSNIPQILWMIWTIYLHIGGL